MLDETQRLAGNIPMNLRVGDVQAVPHADESFDFSALAECDGAFPALAKCADGMEG